MDEKSDGYQKQETNLDHYKHKILEECLWDLAVVKGKPKPCSETVCRDCDFNKDGLEVHLEGCIKKSMDWIKQQYIKPNYKITKFEKDLLQSCLGTYELKDVRILTRMKEKGYFKSINEDAMIEDILANCDITEED